VKTAILLAAVWSMGLVIAAAVVPVYQSSSTVESAAPDHLLPVRSASTTLVQENGPQILAIVGIPLLTVALVSLSLWRRRANLKRGAGPFACTVLGLLAVFTTLSMLSIGIFVLPVTGCLSLACALA